MQNLPSVDYLGLKGSSNVLVDHMYNLFKATNSKEDREGVTKTTHRVILEAFNNRLVDRLIEGHVFHFKYGLGTLQVMAFKSKENVDLEKNFKKKKRYIDWKKYKEHLDATGEKKWFFFESAWKYKYRWSRNACQLKNKSIYVFRAANNSKVKRGAKGRLTDAILDNPKLELVYRNEIPPNVAHLNTEFMHRINSSNEVGLYNSKGQLIKTYASIRVASAIEGVGENKVRAAIKANSIYSGYYWRYTNKPNNTTTNDSGGSEDN